VWQFVVDQDVKVLTLFDHQVTIHRVEGSLK
jgi:hypothetical protein